MHVPTQVQALQAKVISRLLEPERLAWKVFQLYHLSQALSGSALGLWGQHPVQHAQYTPIATASPAVSLRDGLQSSSSSPPSVSPCHAATGRLKRTAVLQQADFSAYRRLRYHQQCLPCCTCRISDTSAKAPYAFSGHHQGSSPTTFTAATATTAAGTGAAFNFVGTSSSMARRCQLSPSSHLVSSSLGLRRQLIQDAQTGQLHTMNPHVQLLQTPSEPVSKP